MADTLEQMVVFRFLQGMCGAALVPLSQATMLDIYPFERRAQAMAIFGMGVMVGPITGPTLGGYLTEMYNWRYVFYVNLPFGILAVTGLLIFLPKAAPRSELRFDWTGFAVLAMGVAALQLMLDRGQKQDWFSSREIVIEAVLAGLGLYLFVVHMFTAKRPFLPPGLFKDRNFVCGVSMVFCTATVMLASSALMAPYLESLAGYPVATAGLSMAPRGIGTMIGMQVASRLANVVDHRKLMAAGLLTAGLRAVLDELLDAGRVAAPDDADVHDAGLRHRLRVQSDDGDGVHHAAAGAARLCHVVAVAVPQPRAGGGRVGDLADAGAQHADVACRHRRRGSRRSTGCCRANDNVSHMLDPATRHGAAMLDQMINHQAQIIAFNNDFRMMTFVVVPPLLLLLLMRKHERRPVVAGAGGGGLIRSANTPSRRCPRHVPRRCRSTRIPSGSAGCR